MALEIRTATVDGSERSAVHRDWWLRQCQLTEVEQIEMWLEDVPEMYLDASVAGSCGGDRRRWKRRRLRRERWAGQQLFAGRGGGGSAASCWRWRSGDPGGRAGSAYLEATRNACEFYRRAGFVERGTGVFSRGNGGVEIEIVKMERSFS
jgi:hypothetical protein